MTLIFLDIHRLKMYLKHQAGAGTARVHNHKDHSLVRHLTRRLFVSLTLWLLAGSLWGMTPQFSITVPGPADTTQPDPSYLPYPRLHRTSVALALSGGGARGFAQVGVLQAFEQENIPINLIVGTSIGALMGGFYASGYSAEDLKRLILSADWEEILFDRPARTSLFLTQKRLHGRHIFQIRFRGIHPEIPLGLTHGHELTQRLMSLLERAPYHPYPDFDHLDVPFRAIATDLYTGDEIVFRDGDLTVILRASMSLPLILTPVDYHGMLLVDGGVRENIPVQTVRNEGVSSVIAVNTSAPAVERHVPDMPWEIADRVTTIMQQEDNRDNLNLADIVITPDVSKHGSTDFSDLAPLIEAGYRAAMDKMSAIKDLLAQLERERPDTLLSFSAYTYTHTGEEPPENPALASITAPGAISLGDLSDILSASYESGRVIRAKASLDNDTLNIHFDYTPTVQTIDIHGNNLIGTSELLRMISQPVNAPINLNLGRKDLRQILNRYRSIGATEARIDTVIFDQATGLLDIRINEGIITGIQVEGLRHFHRWGVLREFPLRPGDIFLVKEVERGMQQIYSTELFENAYMVTDRTPGGVLIRLHVNERETQILRWGARFDLERKGHTFLEYVNDNLFGVHTRLVLFGKYGEKDENYSASLISDRLFKTYLSPELSVYFRRNDWNNYDLNHEAMGGYDFARTGARFALGLQAGRWGEIGGGIRAEQVLSTYVGQQHELGLRMIELRATIDTQDRTPFPNHGYYFSILYQTAMKTLNSDASFTKIDWQGDSYMEISRRHVMSLHFQWGVADATIPYSEKFRLGGQNSLLGLHEGELVGNARLRMGISYRFDLISRYLADAYLSAHYSAGGVWNGADYSIDPEHFLQGIGASFSLNTLLGPITVTYGHLIPAQGYKENNIIYFSAGHQF
jgi:NTE family protein